MNKKIAITGGGTGGHVFPALAVAEALREKDKNIDLLWIGETHSFEERACKESNIDIRFYPILGGKLRRYFSLKNFLDFFKFFIGLFQSLFLLKKQKVYKVFSKGGYVALPVVLAAWVLRIPVVIHDSDSVPGMTTKISARFAEKICLCFQGAKKHFSKNLYSKIYLTGLPIRQEITEWVGRGTEAKKRIHKKYFSSEKLGCPIIFILGGSQGALAINKALLQSLNNIVEKTCVLHLTGAGKSEAVSIPQKYKKRYQSLEFISDPSELAMFYAAADLIIMRSSSAILEASLFTQNLLLVPLPSAAGNHQEKNAKEFISKNPSAVILAQEPPSFSELLKKEILLGIAQKPLASIPKSIHKDKKNAAREIIQFLL